MEINLDDLIGTLTPDPVIVRLGGASFVVNDLTVAQVLRLSKFGEAKTDKESEANIAFVAKLFKKAPPQIAALKASFAKGDSVLFGERQRLLKEVALIASAISMACNEVAGSKKIVAATAQIRSQLDGAAHSDSSPA